MAIEDRLEELFMNDSNNRRVTSVSVPQRPSPWRGVVAFAGAAAIVGIVAIAAILALRGEPQAAAPITASPIPTSSSVPSATTATTTQSPSATSVAPPFVPPGGITGLLGYPSDFIPAMKVFAVSTADSSKWYRVDTPLNPTGATYTLSNVPAGTYKVYAYTSNSTPTNFAGGSYTEYVRCGMQPPCTDHTVIVITVTAGQTTTGVDLRDWYAPQGAYPPPPA
jgi:hypothetical protein